MTPATERPGGIHGEHVCDHQIPLGWAHCRCGSTPLQGADWCACLDHKAERDQPRRG